MKRFRSSGGFEVRLWMDCGSEDRLTLGNASLE
jgi:hypothetical protein